MGDMSAAAAQGVCVHASAPLAQLTPSADMLPAGSGANGSSLLPGVLARARVPEWTAGACTGLELPFVCSREC